MISLYKIKEFIKKKEGDNLTFDAITTKWLEHKKILIKESTYSNYVYSINKYLLPTFKDMKLKKLQNYNFNEYIEMLMESLSSKTIRDIICVLKSILCFAEDEYNYNFKKHKIICPKIDKDNLVVLSKREKTRLENYCLKENTLRSIGIVICLNTGIRVGEICALKWKNIDLEKNELHIKHTLQRIYDKDQKKTKIIIDKPKTRNSVRNIPISNKLHEILKELRKEYKDDDFFLTGDTEKYIEPRTYQYIFKDILRKSKIKKYKFHILRHTFATECIEVGMDVKSLSEILGHANVEITLNKYVHSSYKIKKKYLEKL